MYHLLIQSKILTENGYADTDKVVSCKLEGLSWEELQSLDIILEPKVSYSNQAKIYIK